MKRYQIILALLLAVGIGLVIFHGEAHATITNAATFLTEVGTNEADWTANMWTAAGYGLGVLAGLIMIGVIIKGVKRLTGR